MEEGEEQCTTHNLQEPTPTHNFSNVSNPLHGVVLCCTSIPPEKRTELAQQAEQMGAQHKYDLTSEVTHLIVGNYDTPKYRYVAKERPDVKALAPRFIEAIRELWIEDKPINVHALEKQHTLPIFAGLRICLTGFEDQEQRQQMITSVEANGGEYHGDLTKKVTHLIASRPEGAKYKHGKSWGLHLVSVEWFRESLQRGMILEENLFNPELPLEERGKGAWIRQKSSPLGKRQRNDSTPSMEEGKRKLRRTASTKLTSQNEKIWGDIVGGGSSTIQAARSSEWDTKFNESPERQGSVSVAPGETIEAHGDSADRPSDSTQQSTFIGCHFYIHGFEHRKVQVLEKYLLSHRAQISMSLDHLAHQPSKQLYMVVPHSLLASKTLDVTQYAVNIQTVSDWWVERCLGAKRLVDPAEYLLGCPFRTYPLLRFGELKICSTGFEGMPLLHISKAVALMGAKYEETFSKDASVLICNPIKNLRREKLKSAQEWKIPVVSLDWLLDSIRTGERQVFRPYLQRSKKSKTQPTRGSHLHDKQSSNDQSEDERLGSGASEQVAKDDARPTPASKIDPTAFEVEKPVTVKPAQTSIESRTTSFHEPLHEVSANSSRKTKSPSKTSASASPKPAPLEIPLEIPLEAISTAITSLFAKSKNATNPDPNHPQASDASDIPPKKRAPNRILGRAASNVSVPSERASSVDSTASTGAAVIWPSTKSKNSSGSSSLRGTRAPSDIAAISMMRDLEAAQKEGEIAGDENGVAPPQTQMQYEDPESSEYKARVLARIRGEKLVERGKEVVATIGSLDTGSTAPGPPRTRTRRSRA